MVNKMAIQSMQLDPNAVVYTDDEIVGKVNAATANITRASSVSAAARPLAAGEVDTTELAAGAVESSKLDSGVAAANLDSMADTARGYIKTAPTTGEFKVVSLQRDSSGKLDIDYDDVAES